LQVGFQVNERLRIWTDRCTASGFDRIREVLSGTREAEVAVIRVTKKMMDEAIAIDEAAGDTNMTSQKLKKMKMRRLAATRIMEW
jgi:hypothetical protein